MARGWPILALLLVAGYARGEAAESFGAFLAGLRADAATQGIASATFDSAFAGVTPDPGVIAAMQREPEYGKPMSAYLASLVSPARIATGLRKSAQWNETLRAVEKRFGVDASILVSIWGIESSFGRSARSLGRVPLAGHARLRALSAALFPQRIVERT